VTQTTKNALTFDNVSVTVILKQYKKIHITKVLRETNLLKNLEEGEVRWLVHYVNGMKAVEESIFLC
jgi:hypothetical protein